MPIPAESQGSTRVVFRRLIGVRIFATLFNQLATLPLLVVALTILVQTRFSWRAVLLFPLLLIATGAVISLAQVADANAIINELVDFRTQFPNMLLTPVPVEEYLTALRNKVPRLQSKRSDEILPLSAKLQKDRIRILVRASAASVSGPLPPSLVTYASTIGAWVILADPPERLSGLGYFLLLHELGHTAFLSFASRLGLSAELRNVLFASVFLVLLINPTRMQAIGLAAMALLWLVLMKREQHRIRSAARVLDEISADTFALERCDPAWFKRYAVSEIVSFLSRMDPAGVGRPWTQEEIDLRTRSFSEDLRRLAGEQPLLKAGELDPGYDRLVAPQDIVLVALMVLFGFAHAPLGYGRLALLFFAALPSTFLALAISFGLNMQNELVDHIMGVKPITPERMLVIEKAFQGRKKLKNLIDSMKRNQPSASSQDAEGNIRM